MTNHGTGVPGYPPSHYAAPPAAYPPPGVGLPRPVALEAVPGSPFGVAIVGVAPTTSGPAVGSLVLGLGSILISLVVFCFGALGASGGWGPIVAGAFGVLAGLLGIAAAVLGWIGYRQIKRAAHWGATKGTGMAVTGLICGLVGIALTITAVVMAVLLTTASA